MWTLAYSTKNLIMPVNNKTKGQCGGLCAVWLDKMLDRGPLDRTNPEATDELKKIALDTHLAGLHLGASKYTNTDVVLGYDPTGRPIFKKHADLARLAPSHANERMAAAAGLRPERSIALAWQALAAFLVLNRNPMGYGGHFIDIGGHAIATFVTSEKTRNKPEGYEPKKTLFFFDPNEGCFYSDDETSFISKFTHIHGTFQDKKILENYQMDWNYFKVHSMHERKKPGPDGYDTDLSSLFQQD